MTAKDMDLPKLDIATIRKRLSLYQPGSEGAYQPIDVSTGKPFTDFFHKGDPYAAAVLIPLIKRENGLSVILTKRTAHLHSHPGQVSFPGGGVDEGDKDTEDAALRESEEEIGLPRDKVEIIGRLSDYYVGPSHARVAPYIGYIADPVLLAPDPFEVDEIFEVPLAYLMETANIQKVTKTYTIGTLQFYAIDYGKFHIWGATAGMIVNLYDALKPSPGTHYAQTITP